MTAADAARPSPEECGYDCPFTREAHERGMADHPFEARRDDGRLAAALRERTWVGPETPGRPGLDPRSFTVHNLPSHFTEDPCEACAALAAEPAPEEDE